LLLTGWGLLVIWRISPAFGARQTGWFLVALAALVELLRRAQDLAWLRRYRYLWLAAGIVLTALTLFLGTNPSGGEPRLWLGCCGLYLQPSEPLRLLLIVFLASYLGDRIRIQQAQGLRDVLPVLGPLFLLWAISVGLLAAQRDLGTGSLFLLLLGVLVFLSTGRWSAVLATGGILAIASLGGAAAFRLVRQRLDAWIDPWADPIGGAYQIVQSMIAIASGGVLGAGPGLGAPGVVPAAHTDFIFAAVAEEWGLVGGLAMLALLAIVVARGLRAATHASDPFAMLLAAGLAVSFGLQSILILGGVTRLLPLTGLTLPLVSYGGSSLLTNFVGLAFLVRLSTADESARPRFGTRIRHLQIGVTAAWMALALAVGWWGLVRASSLVSRTDNPRRALAERYSPRGSILDRQGRILATTVGEVGGYRRAYPEPAAAPVVGYNSIRYGQAGLEAILDEILRGEAGRDPWTIAWSHLLTGSPPPGLDIRLTLDLTAQAAAAAALSGHHGAVVVLDPFSGDIVALASSPSYDPSRIDQDWESILARTDAVLLNRTTQGRYQPGTALGPLLNAWAVEGGAASLEDRVLSLQTPIDVDGQELGCAAAVPATAGQDLAAAMRYGCPGPLADLGARLGRVSFAAMVRGFALHLPPLSELPRSPGSDVPSPQTEAELRLEAAGQGRLTLSPLQLARAFAALVNGGRLPTLRLVEAQREPGGGWQELPRANPGPQVLSPSVAYEVVAHLETAADEGTAGYAGRAVAGPRGERLTWHLVWAQGPRWVVAVLLEDGDLAAARRVAGEVLQSAEGATASAAP
jgi:cell division protein FtsW (lipid II flippase)